MGSFLLNKSVKNNTHTHRHRESEWEREGGERERENANLQIDFSANLFSSVEEWKNHLSLNETLLNKKYSDVLLIEKAPFSQVDYFNLGILYIVCQSQFILENILIIDIGTIDIYLFIYVYI